MIVAIWAGFIGLIIVMLALDLGVFNRRSHAISAREALSFCGVTIVLALLFNVAVYFMYEYEWPAGITSAIARDVGSSAPYGDDAALKFLAGWLVEYSLSVDNIFVFAIVFQYFRVPREYQHRVLFWGVLGALVLRGLMIGVGAALFHRFDWVTYVFGALLLITAVKMLTVGEHPVDPERTVVVRLARRYLPLSPKYDGERFLTRIDGRLMVTPMFVVLLVVETTDLIFAVDSIPAIFALTRDPFLVFTSNVFAILGLRSLYFALSAMMNRFEYLKASLVFILAFVGIKMLMEDVYHIPTPVSLAVIVGTLAVGVGASLILTRRARPR